MKKNLILGLFLMSVLVISIVGISAEITGEATKYDGVKADYGGGKAGSANVAPPGGDSTDNQMSSSSASAKKSSGSKTCPASMTDTTDVNGVPCCIPKSGRTTGKVLGSLFYRTYSGNVVVTGEMTKENCDKMSSGKGTLGPSNMRCNWITDVVMQSGRLCTMYEGKQVCGRAGEQVHANDGTSFVFKKERRGLGAPAITINVEATEAFRQLPKYSG